MASLSYAIQIGSLVFFGLEPRALGQVKGACDFDENLISEVELSNINSADELFLNPDLSISSVFNKPGKSYIECRHESDCRAVAWPKPEDSKIQRAPRAKIVYQTMKDHQCGKNIKVPFLEVLVSHPARKYIDDDGKEKLSAPKENVRGWIDARILKRQKYKPLYAHPEKTEQKQSRVKTPPSVVGQDCPPEQKKPTVADRTSEKNIWAVGNLNDFLREDMTDQVAITANLLRPFVGQCAIAFPASGVGPFSEIKKYNYDKWKKGKYTNLYDQAAYPLLAKSLNHIPKIPKQDTNQSCDKVTSKSATAFVDEKDLVNVDALARTIYAEMNKCFNSGLEFPMAAAKVAVNRTKSEKRNQFLLEASHVEKNKPDLAKILTAKWQFSVWNINQNEKDLSSLLALCPVRYTSDSEKMWFASHPNDLNTWKKEAKKNSAHGEYFNRVSDNELQIWSQALDIATEAVLYPCLFESRFKSFPYVLYTSRITDQENASKCKARVKDVPLVDGRPVDSFQCLTPLEEDRACVARKEERSKNRSGKGPKKKNKLGIGA